jgi:hypothetical protein
LWWWWWEGDELRTSGLKTMIMKKRKARRIQFCQGGEVSKLGGNRPGERIVRKVPRANEL